MRPKQNQVYYAVEVFELDLQDSPFLILPQGTVQTTHVSVEDLLDIPGMSELRWRYALTTYEGCPLFYPESTPEELAACFNFGPFNDGYSRENDVCVTPKGFPWN